MSLLQQPRAFDHPLDQSGNTSHEGIILKHEWLEEKMDVNDVEITDIQTQQQTPNFPIVSISLGIRSDPLWIVLENPAQSKNKEIIRKKVEELKGEFWSRSL